MGPQAVRVQGRKGSNAVRLNGLYQKRKDVGSRPAYTKTTGDDDKMVIWFWAQKKVWMMTRTSMINTDSAYACVQQDCADPTQVTKPWKVFDRQVGTHKPDKQMRVLREAIKSKPTTSSAPVYQNVGVLRKRKKELETELEQMRKQIDGMEDQMNENGDDITQIEQDLHDGKKSGRIFRATSFPTHDRSARNERKTFPVHWTN